MNKTRNNYLIKLADEVLREQTDNNELGITKILNDGNIEDAYNGSVAALSVSIAMSELRPALAIYFQDKSKESKENKEKESKTKANRRSVLDAIARMISKDEDKDNEWNSLSEGGKYAENLFRYAIRKDDAKLKKEVIDCAIALKQVVRTYNLVKS